MAKKKQLSRMTDNSLEFLGVEERKAGPALDTGSDSEPIEEESSETKLDGR